MSDIFISYSRRDSDFMAMLHKRLTDEGHDVWVDWEDIPPTADWWEEIESAIEEAHVFAFIISANSVHSDICRQEIQYAIDNNKRFIPVLYQEIDDVDAPYVHPAIRSHNWISFADESLHEDAFHKLIDSFNTDPDYLRHHTRILVRAKEWQANHRQSSYLLKGAELRDFQQWLISSQTLEPKPTELQYDYILASQTARTREQLRLAGAIVIAVIVVAIFAVVAFFQQEQIASQNALATDISLEQEATSLAVGTQIAAQNTRIAEVQNNGTSIVQEANIQNTRAVLQAQVTQLRGTIIVYETQNAVTDTPVPTETPVATATSTATETATSTLPPTWTATPENSSDEASEESDESTEEGVSAAGISTATLDPAIVASATAQQELYNTATQMALVSPTPVPTNTPPPTRTLRPSPTMRPTMPPPPEPREQTITYVVQEGDFAVDIADRFGVTVQEIVDANGLSNASLIFVGQQLVIPYEIDLETDETIYVVAGSGEDTPDCGALHMPCQSIPHAMSIADGYVEINLSPGVYNEELVLTDDVVLVGDGMENTILTGDFTGTVITVNPDVNVTIVGMTITGGTDDWGGGIANYGELTLQNVKISGNVANLAGGGVANFGTLIANYVDFNDNYAPYFADIYSAPDAGILADDTLHYSEETSLPEPTRQDSDFNVGSLIEVSTTDGDSLNLRPQSGLRGSPISMLTPGTPLLIIEGPERRDGFRWWRVLTPIGTTGWVADFDEDPTIRLINRPE